jgi:hypothetical protein
VVHQYFTQVVVVAVMYLAITQAVGQQGQHLMPMEIMELLILVVVVVGLNQVILLTLAIQLVATVAQE